MYVNVLPRHTFFKSPQKGWNSMLPPWPPQAGNFLLSFYDLSQPTGLRRGPPTSSIVRFRHGFDPKWNRHVGPRSIIYFTKNIFSREILLLFRVRGPPPSLLGACKVRLRPRHADLERVGCGQVTDRKIRVEIGRCQRSLGYWHVFCHILLSSFCLHFLVYGFIFLFSFQPLKGIWSQI